MLSCRTILIFFQYLNIARHIEFQCQSFPPAGINSMGLRFREVFLERDLTVRPGLRTRFLYINKTKRERERDAFTSPQCNANFTRNYWQPQTGKHYHISGWSIIAVFYPRLQLLYLGKFALTVVYLCTCIHLHSNQYCRCIWKILQCSYKLRSYRISFLDIRLYLE